MPSDRSINFSPTKSFLIKTLVKDIDLTEAILDLIDNSIDSHIEKNIEGKRDVKLTLSKDRFTIEDNCGGIKKDRIYDDVFRFGKKSEDNRETIGVFGVGLKRSIFKMGRDILLESDDGDNFFTVHIDEHWMNDDDDWKLRIQSDSPSKETPLLRVSITNLFPNIANELGNKVFINNLIDKIRRTYPILIKKRVNIYINEYLVEPHEFKLLYGNGFIPLHKKFYIDNVETEIYAGFTNEVTKNDPYGWYVFCNDRLVLDKDTTYRTGWGGNAPNYHYPEDNNFLGLIFFRSQNPSSLPWRTTKDDIQLDSGLYRQAQVDMRQITEKFVGVIHSASRAKDQDNETIGKSFFADVPLKPILEINEDQTETIPEIPVYQRIIKSTDDYDAEEIPIADGEEIRGTERNIVYSGIQYIKEKDLLKKVKKSLKDPFMSNKSVGEKTFDYYVDMEGIETND
jgi:hypothetical protein